MSKQIQVSDELHQRLKGAADAHYRSISGEIEFMMDFIGGRNGAREDVKGQGVWIPDNHPANRQPKNLGATPPSSDVNDLFKSAPTYDPKVAERQLSGELTCCANEFKPCKHWVWDVSTGEGYKNSLSGRFLEVE